MKKLLIATTNKAKLAEYKKYLSHLPIALISLSDLNITSLPSEDGKSFQDISFAKASFYYNLSALPTLSDDSGLEIDALNGAPGIKSARWINESPNDQDLINYTLTKLKNIPPEKRTAQLKTVICLYLNNSKYFFSQASTQGLIAQKPIKNFTPGFPYRAILYLPQYKKYYEQLTLDQHDKINHRKIALEKISKILLNEI